MRRRCVAGIEVARVVSRLYEDFAPLYATGEYPRYTAWLASHLSPVLRKFSARPGDLLDVACGEGTFAVGMARRGLHVTGVDQSEDMLRLARQKARRAGVEVRFIRSDMRSLKFREAFDLATCWFDSLNYLLQVRDVRKTFRGVAAALRPGGLFLFDVNTIFALAVRWQEVPESVRQDTPRSFEVHRATYDRAQRIATLRVTGFLKEGRAWRRVDESHPERGYPLSQIRALLRRAGFRTEACWGSIQNMTPANGGTRRAWFVARKPSPR